MDRIVIYLFKDVPKICIKRIRNKLVKIGTLDGTNFMGMLFKRQGMEILDKNGLKRYAGGAYCVGFQSGAGDCIVSIGYGNFFSNHPAVAGI